MLQATLPSVTTPGKEKLTLHLRDGQESRESKDVHGHVDATNKNITIRQTPKAALKAAFTKFDKDRNGTISRDEFLAILKWNGATSIKQADADAILSLLLEKGMGHDKNEDGKLSFKEAIEHIQNWAKTAVEQSEQGKGFTFKEIDANQDRFISKDELFSFVKDMRMVHS